MGTRHADRGTPGGLRACEAFIGLCAPAFLVLVVLAAVLVPQSLRPGSIPVVLVAAGLGQPVALLALVRQRRTGAPAGWWSVWATCVLALVSGCVVDPQLRQITATSLVVGPFFAAMFMHGRWFAGHLALAALTTAGLAASTAGTLAERGIRAGCAASVLCVAVLGVLVLRRRLDEEMSTAAAALRRADHLAAHDPLTGLLNRRGLLERLVLGPGGPGGGQLGVVIVDIDHFKRVNDAFGHAVGDEVLVRIAALLRSAAREGDLLARLGGEEFLLVVPRASGTAELAALAERLRREVVASGAAPAVTASFGVAVTRPGDDDATGEDDAPGEGEGAQDGAARRLDDLTRRADRMLYRAKEGGRNRVCVDLPS